MVPLTVPKILLPILIITTLIGSVVGITQYLKTVPSTGYHPSAALAGTPTYASLQDFVLDVKNGERNQVVGIYIPGVLAMPVGQQPKNNAGFVTRNPGETTQFGMAGRYGTIGILAHNDLAGKMFYDIQMNQYAVIVYGDGRLEYYIIREVQQYQALSPTSTFSDFVNLDGSEEKLSAGELFTRIYTSTKRLVLQTCLEANGDASWGRSFFIAEPATSQVLSVVQQTSFMLQFASFGLATR